MENGIPESCSGMLSLQWGKHFGSRKREMNWVDWGKDHCLSLGFPGSGLGDMDWKASALFGMGFQETLAGNSGKWDRREGSWYRVCSQADYCHGQMKINSMEALKARAETHFRFTFSKEQGAGVFTEYLPSVTSWGLTFLGCFAGRPHR